MVLAARRGHGRLGHDQQRLHASHAAIPRARAEHRRTAWRQPELAARNEAARCEWSPRLELVGGAGLVGRARRKGARHGARGRRAQARKGTPKVWDLGHRTRRFGRGGACGGKIAVRGAHACKIGDRRDRRARWRSAWRRNGRRHPRPQPLQLGRVGAWSCCDGGSGNHRWLRTRAPAGVTRVLVEQAGGRTLHLTTLRSSMLFTDGAGPVIRTAS